MPVNPKIAIRPALFLFTLALIIAVSGFARDATAQAVTQTVSLDIEPKKLSAALAELAAVTGLSIIAPSSVVQDKLAPALTGDYTAQQALAALLDNSGLIATQSANGTFIIKSAQPSNQPRLRSEAEGALEEVIVYGVKQPISLQDSVESVEVFSASRFDAENLFNINDALARTPNVSTQGDDLRFINIRGIDRSGTTGAGQGVAINVFQDGVPLSDSALLNGSSSAWDIEQLEVLLGSQSTVQGRNSIGGAIVLQSKRPTFGWEGAARARVAEFDTYQASAAISGPLIADQLAFRLSLDHQETDGFITNGFTNEPHDSRESQTVRSRFLIEPEALTGFSALLTFEYNDRDSTNSQSMQSQPGDLDFDPKDRITFPAQSNFNDFESWKYIADISYTMNDRVTLKLLGTYEDIESDFGGTAPSGELVQTGELLRDTYSTEARLEFDFGKLRGFVGGFYFFTDGETTQSQIQAISDIVPFPVDPIDSRLTSSATNTDEVENFAFFTSWRYDIAEKWTIDVNLRYDDERFERQNGELVFSVSPSGCLVTGPGILFGDPTAGLIQGPCSVAAELLAEPIEPQQSDSLSVVLPSGSITYHVTEHASIFAGYRRGYRAGGAFLSSGFSPTELFRVITYDPEFLDTLEAGWRSQWLDRRLTVNGTLFYSEYEDQQIQFRDERGFNVIDNAGETSLYGLELSANFVATPSLSFTASLGLLETSVDDFIFREDNPGTPDNELLDLAGNELGRSPSTTFNLGANYRSRIGVFAGANLNYQSEFWSDIFNLDQSQLGDGLTERIDAAAIVNAQIGYAFSDALTLTLYANNLFDEDAPSFANIGSANAAAGVGNPVNQRLVYQIRQPQTFGVTLDMQF